MGRRRSMTAQRRGTCVVLCLITGLAVQGAVAAEVSREAWVARIKGLRQYKATAFRVGPQLARLDPDLGLDIVRTAWPALTDYQTKRGLLYAFYREKHPRKLAILELGLTDSDRRVSDWALKYLMDAFTQEPATHQAWCDQVGQAALDAYWRARIKEAASNVDAELRGLLETVKAGGDWARRLDMAREAKKLTGHNDPRVIPVLIGVLEADNSYETIYGVGEGLEHITGVKQTRFHDGAWWRRWWGKNKSRYPKAVQATPIPDLTKTASGKAHVPFPQDADGLDFLLKYVVQEMEQCAKKPEGHRLRLSDVARQIAAHKDPRAIPVLIGVLDADNSYDTVYGVGYFALGKLTDVKYSPYHDGAWWRRWWDQNKSRFPKDVQNIPIPDLPKTEHGKRHRPFPEDLDTLDGKMAWLMRQFKDGALGKDIWDVAREIAEFKDPRVIPELIALIEADNSYDTVYGIGYYALSRLTGVKYDKGHDGAWWRAWWEANKSRYAQDVRARAIPDQRSLMATRRKRAAQRKREAALADVADVPAQDLTVGDQARMRYFLIGGGKGAKPPKAGHRLIVVMPGGSGSADFHPFVRRLYKHAMNREFLVAQPVAVKWHRSQQIVWPTRVNPTRRQRFATEDFVEAVIKDVKKRYPIDPRCIFTLTWSSSGPAAYAISLQEKTAVRGSYIAMSVYRRKWMPPLKAARGHIYLLDHSPQDTICPFSHAKQAEAELTGAGAAVRLVTYEGGHGWRGDTYVRVRDGLGWMVKEATRQ